MSDYLYEKNGIVRVCVGDSRLEIPKDKLVEGAVFDEQTKEYSIEIVRLWVEEGKIFVLHLVGFDIAWPHHILEFSLAESKEFHNPVRYLQIHEFLATGRGIPSRK